MSHISLRHIHKAYQKKAMVINDVSLEIFDGEFLVFVGPSGSGKTTMLRMVAGLEEITQGELWINHHYQNDQDPSTRHLSFVFQNYALLPHLTVEENIAFGLINQHLPRLEQKIRIEHVASMLNLMEKLGSYPDQLSGGQRQRVALARALVDQERLVLLDEPLSNLDALLRSGMRTELMRLQKVMKITSLYVTHDQIEAMAMADRLVLMMEGKIIQIGTPMQMYHDPIHLDVIQFIGSPEANIFDVMYDGQTIKIHDQDIKLHEQWFKRINDHHQIPRYLVVRPQDMRISQDDQGLLGHVLFTEHLGSKQLIHLDVNGQTVRVSVNHETIIKDEMFVTWNDSFYLFDQEKKRIKLSPQETISFNIIPDDPVIHELINYGYDITINEEHPMVSIDSTNNKVTIQHDQHTIELDHMYDVLVHFPYIK